MKVKGRAATAHTFFDCVADAAEENAHQAKDIFKRTRPYKLPDNNLHILKVPKPDDSPSYPSGHATYGAVTGLLLALMLPEKKDAIIKRIEDYGESRLISGVHYRSDVYAGQISGAAISASVLSNKKYRQLFKDAKKDLRRALGYRP
jgi:acid phosphatase (class A)